MQIEATMFSYQIGILTLNYDNRNRKLNKIELLKKTYNAKLYYWKRFWYLKKNLFMLHSIKTHLLENQIMMFQTVLKLHEICLVLVI